MTPDNSTLRVSVDASTLGTLHKKAKNLVFQWKIWSSKFSSFLREKLETEGLWWKIDKPVCPLH